MLNAPEIGDFITLIRRDILQYILVDWNVQSFVDSAANNIQNAKEMIGFAGSSDT